MGRKKRKADQVEGETEDADGDDALAQPDERRKIPRRESNDTENNTHVSSENQETQEPQELQEPQKQQASNYAVKSHSGEILQEDIYVSDGSDDEDELVDVVLAGSKMGLMRRGLAQAATQLVQPNRQWTRQDAEGNEGPLETDPLGQPKKDPNELDEEELAKLDPAERAAKILAHKQRKEEEERKHELQMQAEENAGRDPALFSKRTAFDIRLDQIDDKPWERSNDTSDYFNYGFNEDEWNEYAQRQIDIRQELIDASRAKRPPDPNLVPVKPRAPRLQNPRIAVIAGEEQDHEDEEETMEAVGPSKPDSKDMGIVAKEHKNESQDITMAEDVHVLGGAWGAGVAPDSYLAKLIAEQENSTGGGGGGGAPMSAPPSQPPTGNDYYGGGGYAGGYDESAAYGQGPPMPPVDHGRYNQGPPPAYRNHVGYNQGPLPPPNYDRGGYNPGPPPPFRDNDGYNQGPPPPPPHHEGPGYFPPGGNFGGRGSPPGGFRGRGGRGRGGGRGGNFGRKRGRDDHY